MDNWIRKLPIGIPFLVILSLIIFLLFLFVRNLWYQQHFVGPHDYMETLIETIDEMTIRLDQVNKLNKSKINQLSLHPESTRDSWSLHSENINITPINNNIMIPNNNLNNKLDQSKCLIQYDQQLKIIQNKLDDLKLQIEHFLIKDDQFCVKHNFN